MVGPLIKVIVTASTLTRLFTTDMMVSSSGKDIGLQNQVARFNSEYHLQYTVFSEYISVYTRCTLVKVRVVLIVIYNQLTSCTLEVKLRKQFTSNSQNNIIIKKYKLDLYTCTKYESEQLVFRVVQIPFLGNLR